jgi:uncharacterized membrane protein (UPF0127 family)
MNDRRPPKLWISAICLFFLMAGAAGADESKSATDATELNRIFRRDTLQIATPDAKLHKFNIWVADDEDRRARGLMFVKHMNAGDAMLFVYPRPHAIAMWMKNTFIPLDVLFVASDGKVTRVVQNTEPHSLKPIGSGSDVLGFVELAAGTAARLKITEGARVIHPAFSSGGR